MEPAPSVLALLPELPDASVRAALARDRPELERLEADQRLADGWGALAALRLAHLWLAAGWPGRGDDLVLEADALAPAARLIPDWWGLWPPENDPAAGAADAADARALAGAYVQLRHLPAGAAWDAWRQQVEADPRRLDQPGLRLLLGIVIQACHGPAGWLQEGLAELVGEELVAREPALAWRLFDPLCDRLPEWSYARLKAADLSLQRGQLERCRQQLEAASEGQRRLPWLQDISARLALAQGEVAQALVCWQAAIEACAAEVSDNPDAANLVELFRQRAREARRGAGVLAARTLLNRGERTQALELLDLLLQHDPQWQPLRSLREQARGGEPAPAAPLSEVPAASAPNGEEHDHDVARLASRLALLAERAGLAWPPPAAAEAQATSADWERFLQRSLGRLALLG